MVHLDMRKITQAFEEPLVLRVRQALAVKELVVAEPPQLVAFIHPRPGDARAVRKGRARELAEKLCGFLDGTGVHEILKRLEGSPCSPYGALKRAGSDDNVVASSGMR